MDAIAGEVPDCRGTRTTRTNGIDQEVDPLAPEEEATFEYALVGPDDPRAEDGRQIERDVFLEKFENTPEMLAKEYGPYEESSTFVTIRELATGKGTGVIRLIGNSGAGLKSLNDLQTGPWQKSTDEALGGTSLASEIDRTLDIATYAVIHDFRGKNNPEGAFTRLALFRAVVLYMEQIGAVGLIGITDDEVVRSTQKEVGDPFHNYPGVCSAPYLGSPGSTPIWADMREYIPRLREADPAKYESYFNGVGYGFLRAAGSPPFQRATTDILS